MRKNLFGILMVIGCMLLCSNIAFADDDSDDWTKHLDVYNSDGLDKPVSAIEYQKTMKEIQRLKDRKNNKKHLKNGEMPDPSNVNEPVKIEKNDVIKITTPLYYDGHILSTGFYKISADEIDGEYFINLVQGKSKIIAIKANKVSHTDFAPDKVNYIHTDVYQDKYYKISFKNIDYALVGYLAIIK